MAKVLGITGLIGSGKSVVREGLEVLLTLPCFDSDSVAKDAYFDHAVQDEIIAQLGFVPVKDGALDKSKLGECLSSPEKKQKLESIIHTYVADKFVQWKEAQSSEWVGIESAILYTSGFYKMCDLVLAVEVSKEVRRERIKHRDPYRKNTEIDAIMALQEEERKRQEERADIRLDNNSSSSITREIEALKERLINTYIQ